MLFWSAVTGIGLLLWAFLWVVFRDTDPQRPARDPILDEWHKSYWPNERKK